MIQVSELRKEFKLNKRQRQELQTKERTTTAVNNISFKCQPGRVFSLLGPNGAGKTTTLRMLATIFSPTKGEITICNLNTKKNAAEIRNKIGFLTGSTGLYSRLTPHELIQYFAALYKVPKDVFNKRAENLYSLLDMHDFKHKRIGKLSTGMKQKVSICRTMIHDPDVVIFDEPTSGLDVITAENIIALIRDCKSQGKTVIFSSHIMSEVDLLCDDIAIIHKGSLLFNDTMDSFRKQMTSKSLTAEFIQIIENS